jgi:hypothetical protein
MRRLDGYLEIWFAPPSGDGPWVYLGIEVDAAYELPDFITDHFDGDAALTEGTP